MGYRLTGRNSLPYMGVEPPTPPNMVIIQRSPTPTDSQNFNIGTFWVVPSTGNPPEELWVLISLVGGVATWVQLYPSNAGGASQFVEDVGVANELAGVINIVGGATSAFTNINTFGSGNTVEVRLNDTIQLPDTTSGGGQGAIFLGGSSFLHNFGLSSTFLGERAGSLVNNISSNTGIGTDSLTSLTTGPFNTALGSGSASSITSGSNNICLGFSACLLYDVESNNIAIGNIGTVADSQVIRIGTSQNDCYIQGIYGSTIGATNGQVFVDSSGKLGTIGGGGGAGNQAFLAVQQTAPPTQVNGSTYVLGTDQAMTTIFDNGGNFFVGDGLGTPASFTAPITGQYFINYNCSISVGTTGFTQYQIMILTTSKTYLFQNKSTADSGSPHSNALNICLSMTAGDTAEFSVLANYVSVNPYTITGELAGAPPTDFAWVSGFIIT